MYLVLILYIHYFNLNLITDISGRYQYFFHLTKEKSKLEKVTQFSLRHPVSIGRARIRIWVLAPDHNTVQPSYL